jgi:hypothetical protein
MKRTLWNKKIPSYIGLLTLVLFIPFISWVVENNTIIPIKANPDHTPRDVQISNISDSSFTVSYVTTDMVTASIPYGQTEKFGEIAFDIRDASFGKPVAHTAHYITINKLKPNTTYYFTILSGPMTFKNGKDPYIVTTGSTLPDTSRVSKKIAGSVLLPDGNHPTETIVYALSSTSQLLSQLVQIDGSYSMETKHLRSSSLDAYTDIPDSEDMQIRLAQSTMQTFINILGKDISSIPVVTLSKNYDFTYETLVSPSPDVSIESTDTSDIFPEYSTDTIFSQNPQILIPKKDQAFDDLQPEFSGTALPTKNVDISFDTSIIKTTVKANASGTWSYRPKKELEPGNHTIIITVKDNSGMTLTTSQTFAIHAVGSQFFAPSPSESPTPIPTNTPLITPAVSPTIQPTTQLNPTLTISLSPSVIPSITPTLIPSPTQIDTTIPPVSPIPSVSSPGSGSVAVTFGFAIVATLAGIMIFFLTHV